jgi:piezo-type mechanosensitive ion channel component 1/2
MMSQDEQEKKILFKIKMKMDRIKANQQKLQGPAYKEPGDHFAGKYFNSNILS